MGSITWCRFHSKGSCQRVRQELAPTWTISTFQGTEHHCLVTGETNTKSVRILKYFGEWLNLLKRVACFGFSELALRHSAKTLELKERRSARKASHSMNYWVFPNCVGRGVPLATAYLDALSCLFSNIPMLLFHLLRTFSLRGHRVYHD
jgi:hypothetical protein